MLLVFVSRWSLATVEMIMKIWKQQDDWRVYKYKMCEFAHSHDDL